MFDNQKADQFAPIFLRETELQNQDKIQVPSFFVLLGISLSL